ncbi:hypothetical protein PQS31_00090 [Luteimonas sp BLCC-B24]|uniref:hypothetical protein n=1 Tax=Luteimonas sp. BLCC-B24 TaxID=3025317 RepID=UPI00234D1DC5|nr:hypothetical protein [Luteimonas sp. BLCC-B24]MDC7805230.1 hypothetical protein [Luteimonas sp. BLCC-B24]
MQFRASRSSGAALEASPSLLAIGVTVFVAVLLALCAHSLLALVIVAATPEPTAEDVLREMKKWEGIWEQAMPVPPPQSITAAPSFGNKPPRSAPVPGYPGLVEAQRGGHDIACLSGRVSYRIPNGWSSSQRPCRATTQ